MINTISAAGVARIPRARAIGPADDSLGSSLFPPGADEAPASLTRAAYSFVCLAGRLGRVRSASALLSGMLNHRLAAPCGGRSVRQLYCARVGRRRAPQ